jgi:DNA polymerase-3 subunit alpha
LRAVNKRNLENMAKAGVFDFDARYHRAQYIATDSQGKNGIELAVRYGQKVQADKLSGQMGLFGGNESNNTEQEPKLPPVERMTLLEELKIEEELVGVFLSRHPLDGHKFLHELIKPTSIQEFVRAFDDKDRLEFRMMGIVTAAREIMGQSGVPYGRLTIMDYSGSTELSLYRDAYMQYKSFLSKDYVLLISGTLEPSREGNRTIATYRSIRLASDLNPDNLVRSVKVFMRPSDLFDGKHQTLNDVMEQFPGNTTVWFSFSDPEEELGLTLVSNNRIAYSPEVRELFNEMSVSHEPEIAMRS